MTGGRGAKPKITPDRYGTVLALLTSGLTMEQTAAQLGVTRATLFNLGRRDPAMGRAMKKARGPQHGTESCYVKRRCRRPECTAAATAARTARRHAQAAEQVASIYPLPTPPAPAPVPAPLAAA